MNNDKRYDVFVLPVGTATICIEYRSFITNMSWLPVSIFKSGLRMTIVTNSNFTFGETNCRGHWLPACSLQAHMQQAVTFV